jgi:hypothetical protein
VISEEGQSRLPTCTCRARAGGGGDWTLVKITGLRSQHR